MRDTQHSGDHWQLRELFLDPVPPRAQRDWIEVATFDYPLQWDRALQQFEGYQDATVILPVINVDSRLKQISPGKVDFDFQQSLSLQLPRIKSLDFLNDAASELNAPLNSFSNAVQSVLGTAFNGLGLNELQKLLTENSQAFFQPVLAPALQTIVNQILMDVTNTAKFPGVHPGQ